MKLIVNADDFGLNAKVNERILALMSNGRITSATLLANGPAVEDAVRAIPKGSRCSLGIHLNLTEFEPLTPPQERGPLSTCLDFQGAFAGEEVLRKVSVTASLREAMFKELCLQVDKLLALGVSISHFDSHNHIHTMPMIFPVLKRLQKRFGIRKVRTTWNIYAPRSRPTTLLLLKKRLWHWALQCYYQTGTTTGFTSFAVFYELARLGALKCDSIEVEVHPGHEEFEAETQLLESAWQKQIPLSVHLISYDAL